MHPWLQALRHDLVKRAVWPARDLRDSGQQDVAALRRALMNLFDAEGAPVTALALWERMRAEAPPGAPSEPFDAALREAVAALDRPWPAPLQGVLALEDAFTALARAVEKES